MRCVYAWYSFMYDMGVAMVDCAILIVYTATSTSWTHSYSKQSN